MRRLIDDLLSLSRIELDEHVPPSGSRRSRGGRARGGDLFAPVLKEQSRGVSVKLRAGRAGPRGVGDVFSWRRCCKTLSITPSKYAAGDGGVVVEVGDPATAKK